MRPEAWPALRGQSKFDFLVVVAIAGLLTTAFFMRMPQVQEDAERTAVELTLRNLRVGLQLAVGELIMQGNDDRIHALRHDNPLRFLEKTPEGYEGETPYPEKPGGWSYDPNRHELAYRPRLKTAFAGRELLRWHYEAITPPGTRQAGLRIREAH